MARRLGERSSGPRTVGYDANPRGLAGSNSTATDYKNKKKQKEKEQQVQLGKDPPYEQDGIVDTPLQAFDEKNYEERNPSDNPYKEEKVVLKDKVKIGEGVGWSLSLTCAEKGKKVVITAQSGSKFYIVDVSDKGQIKLPTAPLENGMVKHDHKVIMPKTLRVTGWVKREDAEHINAVIQYAEISKSLGTYFELVSPWKMYPRMYLQSYSSKASSRKYDVYDYTLDLSELLIATDLKDTTDKAELASNTDKGSTSGK